MPKPDRLLAPRLIPYLSLLFLLLVVAGSGCGFGDFFGAYFNTFYNAQKLFSEAEEEVLNQQRDPRLQDQGFLPPFNVPASAKTKFTSVIEKCSKLLQYHPESGLVDDALLMIGQSYYYQNENQKAERKFLELLEAYPQSELALEARLLLARAYYRMDDKSGAENKAKELLQAAQKEERRDYVAKTALLLAQIEVEKKNTAKALEYYRNAAEVTPSAEDRTRGWMHVGDLQSEEGQASEALKAYRRAEDASADYVAEFRSRIAQARVLRKLDAYDESLDRLEDLRSNSNYRDFYGEIDLEIGNTYRDMNDLTSAIDQYTYVDTTYARTEPAAKAYYELGLIYETRVFQFDSARVAYSKGRNEAPFSPVSRLIMPRADYMNRWHTHKTEITRFDSIKTFILYPPPDTGMTAADSAALDSLRLAGVEGLDTMKVRAPRVPPPPLDTVNARLEYHITELAGLFYTTIGIPDSATKWYRRLLIEYPVSRMVPLALFSLAQIEGQKPDAEGNVRDSLYSVLVERFPESEFAQEARRFLGLPPIRTTRDQAETLYSQAESLMNRGNVRSAVRTFDELITRYPSSPVAAKAQFAIGWIYEEVNPTPDSAIARYEQLIKLYPKSPYASRVQSKLDVVAQFRKERSDSVAADSARAAKGVLPGTEEQLKRKESDPEASSEQGDDDEAVRRKRGKIPQQDEGNRQEDQPKPL